MKRILLVLMIAGCATPNGAQPAASQPSSQPASAPSSASMSTVESKEVTYTTGDLTMKGYLAWDSKLEGKRPGVLVVHEWWGHNAYARRRADDLAKLGYVAFAIDMYGDGKVASHPKDAGAFAGAVMADPDGAQARFEAALAELNAFELTDATKTAAIGYCFGGGVVLHMARRGVDLDAVASFHGSLGTKEPATKPGQIKAKILVAHGGADPFVSKDALAAFQAEMKTVGADLRFRTYDGVVHGFTNPEADKLGKQFKLPLKYDASADKQSWEEMKALFQETFGS